MIIINFHFFFFTAKFLFRGAWKPVFLIKIISLSAYQACYDKSNKSQQIL